MIAGPRKRQAAPAGDAVWLCMALALGALLRCWNLSSSSLYSDEAFTFAASGQSIAALLQTIINHDFHPPLFYLMTHVLMGWLHRPLPQYRFVTAGAGLVTIAATWGFARREFGPVAAAVAAFVVALAPSLVQYDRLYRMHALTVALCALSWWLLAEIAQAPTARRRWLWAAYAIVAAVMPYVDYFGGLVLLAQAAYAFARRRALAPVFACLAVAAVAFVPWVGALRMQFPLGGVALSRPALDSGLLASVRSAFGAGIPDAALRIPHFDALFAVLVLALALTGAWLGRGSALPFWLGVLPLQIVLSLALGKNLAFFPRYLLLTVPALAVAVGALVAALAAQRRALPAAAVALAVMLPLASGTSNLLFNAYYQFPDWYAVDALLQARAQSSDGIVLDEGYEYLVVRNYRAFQGHPLQVFMNPSDFPRVLHWIQSNPQRRVWYVEHQNFYWDPQRRILAALASQRKSLLRWNEVRQSPVDAVRVELFDRIPMIKVR